MNELLRTFKATADTNRLRILRILGRGPFNVAELTQILGVGQSTVSRHLKILAEAGLVEARRAGTWAYYSLRAGEGASTRSEFPGKLLELLEGAWNGDDRDAAAVERALLQRRQATSAFFRDTAGEWDRVRDQALGPPAHLDRLIELVGRGGTVVDLGTGTGVLLERLGPFADRLIGIDASAEMLEVASRRAEEAALGNVELRLGMLEHLPLSDGEADAMVANLVLHHVADPPAVFREIRRGLADAGRLVIVDLEEHDDEAFWRSLGARWPGFRTNDVREWLLAAGFESIRTERFPVDRAERDAKSDKGARPLVFLAAVARGNGESRSTHQTRRNG